MEKVNVKYTGNVTYIGHLASYTKGISDKVNITKGVDIGIMGATGLAVAPVGFIHANIEFRSYNINNWTCIHEKTQRR